MKIELRNVKVAAFASEETTCFQATIYVDGKRCGTARNDGHGGCTWIEPQELRVRINSYAQTLPDKVSPTLRNPHDESLPFSYAQDAESLIDDALHAHLVTGDLKRLMKRAVVFTKPDGRLYQVKPRASIDEWLRTAGHESRRVETLTRLGALQVLNWLPFDRALAVYLAATAN